MQSRWTLGRLLDGSRTRAINGRRGLCRQAAAAAFYTHTSGLVHKSIRPEAFLVFRDMVEEEAQGHPVLSRQRDDNDGHGVLGTLYLTGFELAREDNPGSYSSMRGSVEW